MNRNQLTDFIQFNNVLYSVLLELTYRCNLDCNFCYNDTDAVGKSLSLKQYLKLLGDLEELGTMHLTLSGGEPLAHPEFFPIGRAARERGFAVRIKSNGHALNERMARRIQQEIDPFGLDISLHGASPETHDKQTRVPGSFYKLINNLETLKKLGMRFHLNAPVTIWNEHELEEMCEIADRFEVDIMIDGDITPTDNGDRTPMELATSAATQFKILQLNRERAKSRLAANNKKSVSSMGSNANRVDNSMPTQEEDSIPTSKEDLQLQKKQCGAGSTTMTVDPYGSVYPCVQWRQPVGNLHVKSIIDIWTDSQSLRKIRSQLIELKNLNVQRGINNNVGFCAARAHQETGSSMNLYPLASLRAELHDRLNKQ